MVNSFSSASLPRPLDYFRPTISFELSDTPLNLTPEQRALWWVRKNKTTLISAEQRWRVNREAIAGVVFYEALANPEPATTAILTRYSGPGKVHYKQYRLSEGDPLSKRVEDLGYLPRRPWRIREAILATDSGAITYIGAILCAFSDVARRNNYSVRSDVPTLLTFYSAWDLPELAEHLNTNRHRPLTYNTAGLWITSHRRLLIQALGR